MNQRFEENWAKRREVRALLKLDWVYNPGVQAQLITFMRDEYRVLGSMVMRGISWPELWYLRGRGIVYAPPPPRRHSFSIDIGEEYERLMEPILEEVVAQAVGGHEYDSLNAIACLGQLAPPSLRFEQILLAIAQGQYIHSDRAFGALEARPTITDGTVRSLEEMLDQGGDSLRGRYIARTLGRHYAQRGQRQLVKLLSPDQPGFVTEGALESMLPEVAQQSQIRRNLWSCLTDRRNYIAELSLRRLNEIGEDSQTFQDALKWLSCSVPGRTLELQDRAARQLNKLTQHLN